MRKEFALSDFYSTFAIPNQNQQRNAVKMTRALSSVGSEHLVYTEGVGGSNPSAPTLIIKHLQCQIVSAFFYHRTVATHLIVFLIQLNQKVELRLLLKMKT